MPCACSNELLCAPATCAMQMGRSGKATCSRVKEKSCWLGPALPSWQATSSKRHTSLPPVCRGSSLTHLAWTTTGARATSSSPGAIQVRSPSAKAITNASEIIISCPTYVSTFRPHISRWLWCYADACYDRGARLFFL